MSANTELVDRFIAAWKTEDVDHIVSFFHDDAVYTNVPIDPPNRGIEAIRTMIGGFLGMAQAMEFVVHHSAENAAAGKQGGTIAKGARLELERKTGRRVVTEENFLPPAAERKKIKGPEEG